MEVAINTIFPKVFSLKKSLAEENKRNFEKLNELNEEIDKKTGCILDKAQQISEIFDLIPASVFLKDTNNNILQANDAFYEMFNLKKEDVIGKNVSEWSDESDEAKELVSKYLKNDLDVIRSGKSKLGIIEKLCNNLDKTVRTDKVPMFNQDGEVIGIIGFSVDITNIV